MKLEIIVCLLDSGSNGSSVETSMQNGNVPNGTSGVSPAQSATTKNNHRKSLDKGEKQEEQHKHGAGNSLQSEKSDKRFVHSNGTTVSHSDIQFIERVSSVNDFDANEVEKDKTSKGSGGGGGGGGSSHNSVKTQQNGSAGGKWNNVKESRDSSNSVNGQRERKGRQAKSTNDYTNDMAEQQKQQDEYDQRVLLCRKLEADIKRLKSDLQCSRGYEQELKSTVSGLIIRERLAKSEIQQLQNDNEQLQNKLVHQIIL